MAQSADGGTSGGVPEFTIPGVTAHDPGTKGAAGRRRAAADKKIAIIPTAVDVGTRNSEVRVSITRDSSGELVWPGRVDRSRDRHSCPQLWCHTSIVQLGEPVVNTVSAILLAANFIYV